MAAVMLSSVAMHAQQAPGTITIQPKVGLNIATLTDLKDGSEFDNTKSKSRVGFAAGAEAEYQISDMFSVSAGLIYSQKGAKVEYDALPLLEQSSMPLLAAPLHYEETLKCDYLDIPILANVYVAKGLAVKLGLQPAFKLSGKAKMKVEDLGEDEFDIEEMKGFELSIPVGISYEYQSFVLDARYNWGLTKVFDYDDFKNSVFQITLGYKIPL